MCPFKENIFIAVGLVFFLTINGCVSIPRSPTPRFYLLKAKTDTVLLKKYDFPADIVVGIGPVKIPEYLDRPQLVTISKEGTLVLAQFDRWGESFNVGVERLTREYLTKMIPGVTLTVYPWGSAMPVRYQVAVEVVELECELNKDLHFVAQWQIIDLNENKSIQIKRFEFRQPVNPQNYAGLVKTLGSAWASISNEIAEALSGLKSRD